MSLSLYIRASYPWQATASRNLEPELTPIPCATLFPAGRCWAPPNLTSPLHTTLQPTAPQCSPGGSTLWL